MPPVVPGAVGYGMSTRAAYGDTGNPTIYTVTSLADTNTVGTFRYACTRSGPRVVIFHVSGYIDMTSDITISNPYLTIAGQTAPSPGITLRAVAGFGTEKMVIVDTHDVLFQHFRDRPGDDSCNSAIQVYGFTSPHHYNIVFDHMSLSWGQDEGMSVSATVGNGDGNANVTLWRCIMAEGIFQAAGSGGCTGSPGGALANGHGMGCGARNVAVIQSIFANNAERNPQITGDGCTSVLLNNVVYDWGGAEGFLSGVNSGGAPWRQTAVGNRFIVGPSTTAGAAMFFFAANPDFPQAGSSTADGCRSYRSDNTYDNAAFPSITPQILPVNGMSYDPTVGSPPTETPIFTGYTPLASSATEAFVLNNAGARPADRDGVDARIIAYIGARTSPGRIHDIDSDAGGYPTLANNTRSLTVPSNPHVVQASGYTALEEWLQGYAAVVEGGEPVIRDPAVGRGFVVATFTGTSGNSLTAYTSEVGGGWSQSISGVTGTMRLSNAGRVLNDVVDASIYTSLGVPVSAEYDVDCDFRVLTLIPGSSYHLIGRVMSPLLTWYYAGYNVDAGYWILGLVNNGDFVTLGTYTQALSTATTYHVTLEVRNESKHLLINDVQRISSSDNTITTAGRAGMWTYSATTVDTNTTGIHYDNFMATDVRSYPFVWPRCGGM